MAGLSAPGPPVSGAPVSGAPVSGAPVSGASVLIVLAGVAGWIAWKLTAPRRMVIEGYSMSPLLLPGDRVLSVRCSRMRPGDVVAARDPRAPSRVIVKRVAVVERDGGLYLIGDNPPASTDSRTFGALPRRFVIGRVTRCYSPPERARRIKRASQTLGAGKRAGVAGH